MEEPVVEETIEETVTEEHEAVADDAAEEENAASPYEELHRIGVEQPLPPEMIDLLAYEVGDIAVAHEVTLAMVERLGAELYAVRISETVYVGHTLTKIRLDPIPTAVQKRLRPRTKNLVFTDSTDTIGLPVPYTRSAYFNLPRRERKRILQTAVEIQRYGRAASRLALLRHLGDERMIDKLTYYEAYCRSLAEGLSTTPEWKQWIKEP